MWSVVGDISEDIMGKLKLIIAGLALAAASVAGLGAPAHAADVGGVADNVWCC